MALSLLLFACMSSPVVAMDGLDTSQAKVLDMVGTWMGSAAADVLQRADEYLTWRSDMMSFLQGLRIAKIGPDYFGGQKIR